MKKRIISAVVAASIAASVAALAGNTTFFTNIGDLVFPFTAPLRDGTAGLIDNMTIGATTPRAGTFTSVTNTGGGALTADSITGTDASLGITGQAAAQGGAVATVGGTSSTAANAGGAVTAVGGTPGATGVGGAVSSTGGAAVSGAGGAASLIGGAGGGAGLGGAAALTGGLGGATNAVGGAATVTAGAGNGTGNGAIAGLVGGASGGGATGAGGVSRLVGGASAASNGAGGAAQVTGGLGVGTGAGGAVTITGGTAGSTGLGGAVNIAAGVPISGAGSTVTLTASAGVASTNGGGDVNLVPGAAAGAGIPGAIKVNGNANLMCASYYFTGTPAATSQVFYIANRPLIVTSLSNVFSVAAGGTSTLDVTKDTGTAAPAGGTALGQAAFNLAATANTVQNATLNATIATITMAAGDRLAVKFNHAIQASVGVVVTACMAPL